MPTRWVTTLWTIASLFALSAASADVFAADQPKPALVRAKVLSVEAEADGKVGTATTSVDELLVSFRK